MPVGPSLHIDGKTRLVICVNTQTDHSGLIEVHVTTLATRLELGPWKNLLPELLDAMWRYEPHAPFWRVLSVLALSTDSVAPSGP
jgi:hypothetical protein